MTRERIDAARIDEILRSDSPHGPMDDVWSRHGQSLCTYCREYLEESNDRTASSEQLLTELVSLDTRHPGTLGTLVAAMLRLPMDRVGMEQRSASPNQHSLQRHLEFRAGTLRRMCEQRMQSLGRLDTLRALLARLADLKNQMKTPDFASQPNSAVAFHDFVNTRDRLAEHPAENLLAVLVETTDPERREELWILETHRHGRALWESDLRRVDADRQ